jgi:TolB-like protein
LKDIVNKTSAEYLFTGNIQYHVNQVRVNIQLVYAQTMEKAWGQTYNRVIDDSNLFETQDEIVYSVITEMEVFWGSKARMKSEMTTMVGA